MGCARASIRLLGGAYGRRVVVVAGKGHNGDDGRVAAGQLARRGVGVEILDATTAPARLPRCDLVIDAAYGTGFRGQYVAPEPPPLTPVLAVDIPSGVDGDTGTACTGAVRANATVTFGALKPGLLFGEGALLAGVVEVAPIGLDVGTPRAHLVEDLDVLSWLPRRPRDAHKWNSAVYVVAGSPGMLGSASLCSTAALRAGAGMVRLASPGVDPAAGLPASEIVRRATPLEDWAPHVLDDLRRSRVLVLGPGLGASPATAAGVRRLMIESAVPIVLDADGLGVIGAADDAGRLFALRRAPVVITPHDGEYARLVGAQPGRDRIDAAADLAERTRAVVLLKGPTTVVASPEGDVLLGASGLSSLATAGTGDVLSGVIGAFIARGVDPFRAAALAAHVHGRAAALGPRRGSRCRRPAAAGRPRPGGDPG